MGKIRINENNLRRIIRKVLFEATVFHGSRSKFDKFSTAYMLSGYGEHKHGWGIYLAANARTSLWFMHCATQPKKFDELRKQKKWFLDKYVEPISRKIEKYFSHFDYKGSTWYDLYYKVLAMKSSKDGMFSKLEDIITALKYIRRDSFYYGDSYKKIATFVDNILSELDHILEMSEDYVNDICNGSDYGGYHYIVKIPDDNGKNYLHPKSAISMPEVAKIFKKVNATEQNEKLNNFIAIAETKTHDVNEEFVYETLGMCLGSDKAASLALNAIGYLGIHYRSNDEGECYIMFNENDVNMIWRDSAEDYKGYDSTGTLKTGSELGDVKYYSRPDTEIKTYKPKISKLYNNKSRGKRK